MTLNQFKEKIKELGVNAEWCEAQNTRSGKATDWKTLLKVARDNPEFAFDSGMLVAGFNMVPKKHMDEAGIRMNEDADEGVIVVTEGEHLFSGKAFVFADGDSKVTLAGNSQGRLHGNVEATLLDNASIRHYGNGQVIASGDSFVARYGTGEVNAMGKVNVVSMTGREGINLSGDAVLKLK